MIYLLPDMNTTRREIIKNAVIATLGLMLFGVGLHMVIQANLGAAPWDVLFIGIADKLGTLYGNISIAFGVILILVDILLLKEHIGIGTIIDAIVVGKTVDFLNWTGILPTMTGSILLRIVVIVVGFFIMGFSQYLYMKMALGYGPKDTFQIGLSRILHKLPVGAVNFIIQGTVLIAGILLGGPFGICSVIAPFGLGLSQQLAFNVMEFDPKSIHSQNIIQTFRILFSKQKGA